MSPPVVFQIPICPFCQRLEILLALKGLSSAVDFQVIDITQPRPDWLLRKTGGSTALPVLETADGQIIKESLVILQYLEDIFPQPPVAQHEPWRRAQEGMLVALGADLVAKGYGLVLNQDRDRRAGLEQALLAEYRKLDDFLRAHAPAGPFLFEDFGWSEVVFTPFFQRFWFLEYYEDFRLPAESGYERVRTWIDACVAHPAARQTSREEVVKLYYDYAQGAGNGALLPGRRHSSFAFDPPWQGRPWPPRDKYGHAATDAELGLG